MIKPGTLAPTVPQAFMLAIHHNYDVNTRALVQHFMTNATQQEVLKLQETVRGPVKIPAPTTPTLHNF